MNKCICSPNALLCTYIYKNSQYAIKKKKLKTQSPFKCVAWANGCCVAAIQLRQKSSSPKHLPTPHTHTPNAAEHKSGIFFKCVCVCVVCTQQKSTWKTTHNTTTTNRARLRNTMNLTRAVCVCVSEWVRWVERRVIDDDCDQLLLHYAMMMLLMMIMVLLRRVNPR